MKISIVNAAWDGRLAGPDALLARYDHLVQLALAIGNRGHDVAVLQSFDVADERRIAGLRIRFVKGEDRAARAGIGRHGSADRLVAVLKSEPPDLVHFNGMALTRLLGTVARHCRATGTPLTASYHGGQPAAGWLGRARQRRSLRGVGRVMMTTRAHAEPWLEASLLPGAGTVMICPETSTMFRRRPRPEARAKTGIKGNPVFLWSARLHPIKDPLCALDGFGLIGHEWPEARLYMSYLSDEMLPEVKARLAGDKSLAARTDLLGTLAHSEMEDFFNSADFFLQSSTREFGGNSLVEALACGAVPVVSDIPSFRNMTGEGSVGVLFPPGESRAMAEGTLALVLHRLAEYSDRAVAYFDDHLSFAKIAEIYDRAFADAVADVGPVAL